MLIVVTIPDQEVETYVFNSGDLISEEAELIEDIPGAKWQTYEEWGQFFLRGNAKAQRAALWVMRRRTNPDLKFKDVSYPVGALRIKFTDDEITLFRENLLSQPDTDPEQMEYILNAMGMGVVDGEMREVSDLKDPSEVSVPEDSTSATPDSPRD